MNSTETQNQEVNLFNIKNFKTQAKTQLQKRKLIPMISVFITGIFTILFFIIAVLLNIIFDIQISDLI